jgi:hypothetical protein
LVSVSRLSLNEQSNRIQEKNRSSSRPARATAARLDPTRTMMMTVTSIQSIHQQVNNKAWSRFCDRQKASSPSPPCMQTRPLPQKRSLLVPHPKTRKRKQHPLSGEGSFIMASPWRLNPLCRSEIASQSADCSPFPESETLCGLCPILALSSRVSGFELLQLRSNFGRIVLSSVFTSWHRLAQSFKVFLDHFPSRKHGSNSRLARSHAIVGWKPSEIRDTKVSSQNGSSLTSILRSR